MHRQGADVPRAACMTDEDVSATAIREDPAGGMNAVLPRSPDPVCGGGVPPISPADVADALARAVRPERLVVPDRVEFHVPGPVEHQVATPGLRQRDPVQVRVAEHRVGRMRQPDPGAVAVGLHYQARAVIARGATGPSVGVPAAVCVPFGPVQSRVAGPAAAAATVAAAAAGESSAAASTAATTILCLRMAVTAILNMSGFLLRLVRRRSRPRAANTWPGPPG